MCTLVLVMSPDQAEAVISVVKGYPCVGYVTKLPTSQPTEVCAIVDIVNSKAPEFYIQKFAQLHPEVRVSLGVQPL